MALLLRDVTIGFTGRRADVRVEGRRLVAVEPPGLPADGAEVVDGNGGTLLPGLVDAHAHLLQWASSRQRVSLAGATSAAHAAELIAAAGPKPGELLQGAGFHAALWPDRPHRTLLDHVLPDQPVALFSNDLHTLWLSSAAMRMMNVDHPTGVFIEDECMALTAALPSPSTDITDRWVLAATEAAAARGITTIADYEYTDTIADWRRRGTPATRIRCVIAKFLLDETIERGLRTGAPAGDLLTVGPLKIFMDGSLNTRTAYCHDHYPDGTYHGELLEPLDQLLPVLRKAVDNGIGLALHAIGDRANTLALDAFDHLGVGGRIEHAQLLDPADVPRFAALGVVAGVQPAHQPDDRDAADRHWAGRTDRAYAFGSLHRAGATLEFGSDAPVATLDPWEAISAAVTRTDDDRPGWHPEQSLPLAVAVAASTGGRGTSVAAGDPADLVLAGRDLTGLPPSELRDLPIQATVLDGRLTHRA
ncbi:amidohydrolase [Actinophytocola glycyrrhizae]|uniref:Amidohydrolase n=1 Tax=Actinophytocola glycyrrhizae TaxID=2044873 RepID=A0ABV9S4B2_9PSEU